MGRRELDSAFFFMHGTQACVRRKRWRGAEADTVHLFALTFCSLSPGCVLFPTAARDQISMGSLWEAQGLGTVQSRDCFLDSPFRWNWRSSHTILFFFTASLF